MKQLTAVMFCGEKKEKQKLNKSRGENLGGNVLSMSSVKTGGENSIVLISTDQQMQTNISHKG